MNKLRKYFDITMIKFVLVGMANTVFGTCIMFVMYNAFGCSYWVSSAANYICGSILSYFLNKYFTFQNKERSWKVVLKFVLNISICYFVAYGIAKPLVRVALHEYGRTIQENCSMLVGMGIFMVLNYFGQRFFAFRTKEKND